MSDKPEEKLTEPSYSSFVSAAMEFLASKTKANVLILVESDKGFEMFRSVASPIWGTGIARTAQVEFETLMLELRARNIEIATSLEKVEEDRIVESQKRDKERAN